jgi:hypothetical protein
MALAGMPSLTLTDVAKLRLETISFFLVGFLLSAWLIQWLWNVLAKDFSVLPRLSYGKALAVVSLWGLLFILVLTMISGARELMTPGAWQKQGLTYRLVPPANNTAPAESQDAQRYERLLQLWSALAENAGRHDGQFPASISGSDIPQATWQVPDPSGMQYIYAGGQLSLEYPVPLAFEPGIFGAERLVLFSNGTIRRLRVEQLIPLLPQGVTP